jgi:hypothetical protein
MYPHPHLAEILRANPLLSQKKFKNWIHQYPNIIKKISLPYFA